MMRSSRIAWALAFAFAGLFASNLACAQRPERNAPSHRAPRPHVPTPPRDSQLDRFDDPTGRSAVSPDLDERRRDGHMTPEERHLLRQHIEDAVRELYKR
ncbi:hypothetical protein bpln_1g22900 [Burkholderia plantarii]|nr:hypothetical protein bpln_1g22900 [Burkholderia plantarii]